MSVERGTTAMLLRHREILAQSAEPVGWKVGFNVPAIQEKLGIDGPLAGFLTGDTLLDDGAVWSLGEDGPVVVEQEVAVELGEDGRSFAALLQALELADPADLSLGVEQILAGNIFHRGVAFGPRVRADEPGSGRVLVNGEVTHELTPEQTRDHLAAMVEAVRRRLKAAGEQLRPGERVITGILVPPHTAESGDSVRLELDALGAVELRFAE